ncbi:MAG: AAA family ATPase [Planctomycetes bacterium]|nr:AAA family ATPase [Planctomycetota bacterium]
MYLDFFNFKLFPFANTADPRFFYANEGHEEALANMTYAVEQGKGMVMITGEVGTGKTLISSVLSLRLRRIAIVVTIADPLVSGDKLMRCVQLALLGPHSRRLDRIAGQTALASRLTALQRTGQRVAVVVDESQDLCKGALEQLRLMSNWENCAEKLLQWVLIGQPEFRETLLKPEWEHLRQRIAMSFHLRAMESGQILPYIQHRLCVASGGKKPLVTFDQPAVDFIFRASRGLPRLINNVCDAALLAAYAQEKTVVSLDIAEQAINEMTSCCWSPQDDRAETTGRLPVSAAG